MTLLLILTACGFPIYDVFYDSSTEQVFMYPLEDEAVYAATVETVKTQPVFEVDVADHLKVNCS